MNIDKINNPLIMPFNAEKSPESFLAFRSASAQEINNQICEKFMTTGQINYEAIEHIFGFNQEVRIKIIFVLERFSHPKSPDKARRKDGSHIATHSLQLFRTVKDFFKISDDNVGWAVLVHDLIEDTQTTKEDITRVLGSEDANWAEAMTEERLVKGTMNISKEDISILSIANFVHKLKKGGETVSLAETVDRIDDISDLTYLTKKLDDSETQKGAINSLEKKFAKCSFTVESLIDKNSSPEAIGMKNYFLGLLDFQKQRVEREFKVIIDQKAIEKNKSQYLKMF